MANRYFYHKIVDNQKRALIKITMISDGTAEANSAFIDASQLAYAMNANGYIMSANTHKKSNYRTTIKRIFGQAKSNGYSYLSWYGDANAPIVILTDGPFNYDFMSMGDGAVLPNNEANANGMILITTNAAKVNDAFTVFVDLRKDARDYDAGQTADPTAFNR